MNKFEINIFTLHGQFIFLLESDNNFDPFVLEFISPFKHTINDTSYRIERLQQNTCDFKIGVELYFEKYKTSLPQLYKLKSFFEKLSVDEFFYVLPNDDDLSSEDKLELELQLISLNRKIDLNELKSKMESYLTLLQNYDIISLDSSKKIKIGEGQKSKRICRFCKKSQPEVEFNNDAHAISEALGNKKIIQNEECDDCNKKFDKEIERDIISFLDPCRILFEIKNKSNAIPKLKGKNFEFKNINNQNVIYHYSSEDDSNEGHKSIYVPLETYNELSLQNVYKALCKFALSIIDKKYLIYCNDSIKWIMNEIHSDKLPKIAILNSYQFFNTEPKLIVYVRKSNDKKIPFMVGEFHFTFLTFVFIIPFSSQDEETFTSEDKYNDFWNCFQYYKQYEPWSFEDFSDAKKKKLKHNLKIEQRKNA